MALHLGYCKDFGLTKEDIEHHEESQGTALQAIDKTRIAEFSIACTAYTRYMLDVGQAEDWFALQICFAPCLIGYGVIAKRLYEDPKTIREGNMYWKWIENYTDRDYTMAVEVGSGELRLSLHPGISTNPGSEHLEKHAVKQSPSRIEELVRIFIHATRVCAAPVFILMKPLTNTIGRWRPASGIWVLEALKPRTCTKL